MTIGHPHEVCPVYACHCGRIVRLGHMCECYAPEELAELAERLADLNKPLAGFPHNCLMKDGDDE